MMTTALALAWGVVALVSNPAELKAARPGSVIVAAPHLVAEVDNLLPAPRALRADEVGPSWMKTRLR